MQAFEAVLGHPPGEDDVPMAGRTDRAISLDLLERNGVSDGEDLLPRMFAALHDALLGRRELMAAQGHPQPGVREALTALRQREDVLQSLLTGNIEPNAELKLAVFDLHMLVDLDVGGYGSDHATRSELVGVARRKARERRGVDASETVVVGDTPLDVSAAHAAGARAVAVATGPYSVGELAQASPDAVLEDVRDRDVLLAALGLPGRT
jgi:phosphoglycolate phosphatase-like HAD superfamily hydrolase